MGKIILNDIEYGIGISNGVNVDTTNLVEKDSIVTVIDENVTDEQVPSAKAVYDKLIDLPTEIPLGQQVYSNTPIGTVLSFAGLTPPNGYLLCDGATYAVADYQDLYDVIGNTYGGDSTNFNVPNLIDRFIQGSDTSGTEKEAGLPNITGEFGVSETKSFYASSPVNGAFEIGSKVGTVEGYSSSGTYTGYYMKLDANNSSEIYGNSDTVQPPALTMVYIIKAFHTNEGTDVLVEFDDNVLNHINNRIDSRVTERMSDLFQSVSDGKTLVANAITDKGVPTAIDATFATMASNIRNLNGIGYKSEALSGSKNVRGGSTVSISLKFSNTVIGVTSVTYNESNTYQKYKGFSISGNTVTVKIEVSSAYTSTMTVQCSVKANILA